MFEDKTAFIYQFTTRIEEKYGRPVNESDVIERYMVLGEMIRDYASRHWKQSKTLVAEKKAKQMYYFSMEFLIGRLFTSNLMNLGLYNIVADGLSDIGYDINELELLEIDAGLGNGGLGRLAACFLDSLASSGYVGHGNCIRYQYGMFKQKIENGEQVEVPDQWLKNGFPWEVAKPKHAVDIKFWGRIEISKNSENGNVIFNHVDAQYVRAVPYDVPVIGTGKLTNTLRLWQAEASELISSNTDFGHYINEVNEICRNVYPDDTTEHGKYLRLKQQYFFVSAGVQSLLKNHYHVYGTLENLAEVVTIQLNDTHPVLVIPELMRILIDDCHYSWAKAWGIVTKTVAYTNHTVLQEALERWPLQYIQKLLPRIYMICEEINRRYEKELKKKISDPERIRSMLPIHDGQIHMANLAVVAAFKVNGVAALHTEILKNETFKNYYELAPKKFVNKTNGVTPRRWLLYSNPQLTELIDSLIGKKYHNSFKDIDKLLKYKEDSIVQQKFMNVKRERKIILAKYIKDNLDIEIDVDSIFDVQAKRIHAYKRQLLNVMHIIYLYQMLETNPNFEMYPRTFIFAGKSAPGYYFAKQVIKLIHAVANKVNNHPDISKKLKVVFIPNYSVSIAEILMNAADVSEQISTAGKEASGTGNMKLMMNGALTLGTLDGANVEIAELVGPEYCEIFGLKVEDIRTLWSKGYNAWDYYNKDQRIKNVMDSLVNGTFGNVDEFKSIFDELMYKNDEYLLLADFESYLKAQKNVEKRYLNKTKWAETMLVNIAKSAFFSSDRTIKEYAKEIWHLNKMNF